MRSLIVHINNLFIPLLPETRFFALKRSLWRMAGAKIGNNVKLSSSLKIYGSGELVIGDNTWIGCQTLIACSSRVEIGCNVDIAPRVYIGTGTHTIDVKADHVAATDISKDVVIGNGCWLCANSMILPGVVLGQKCVVAAGAVVSRTIAGDKQMLAGVPARKVKSYND